METGPSPSASSDKLKDIINDNEDDSEDEHNGGRMTKGKAKMDVRGWAGSRSISVNSMGKRKQG